MCRGRVYGEVTMNVECRSIRNWRGTPKTRDSDNETCLLSYQVEDRLGATVTPNRRGSAIRPSIPPNGGFSFQTPSDRRALSLMTIHMRL